MRVLITGGTGFIGSRLALRLALRGDEVRVLGQENTEAEAANNQALKGQGIEVMLTSVTDKQNLPAALKDVDLVFHFAAAQHEANVPDQHFYDVNVEGTRNVLDAALAAGVQRFVHGSTIGIYGSAAAGEINEATPDKPDNIYGITKLEGEQLVFSYQDKLPVTAIRISETYGPGDRRLLKLFKGIKTQKFFMIGDGQNIHHLIYVEDLIDGMLLASTVDEALGNKFVLAGKERLTTNEMVATIAEVLGVSGPRIRAPLPLFMAAATVMETTMRPLGIQPPLHRRRMDFFKKSFYFSQEQVGRCLGFEAKHTFKEGAAQTASWYREMKYL